MPLDEDDQRPLHVKLVKGRWFWDPPDRLRRSHKLRTQALGADQSAAWAYARLLNKQHLEITPDKPAVGTVAWVLEAFLESDKFKALAASTQGDYTWLARKVLRPLPVNTRQLGDLAANAIRPIHADGIYDELLTSKGHHTAHYACRFARRVWKWARRREMVDENPWEKMEMQGLPARTAVWTAEQVAAMVAMADEQKRPSIGLATLLGYWLGHREGDLLALTWSALEDDEAVNTSKTKVRLPVAIAAYPDLYQALLTTHERAQTEAEAAVPRRVPPAHVVIHEHTGRPYNDTTFRHDFRKIATLAGIPAALQFRDLRATAITELSDSGADIIGMSTHSGHKTPQMARRYARPTAEQFTRVAEQRLAHLVTKTERSGKPAEKQGNFGKKRPVSP